MIEVTGLWKGTSKSGSVYYSGSAGKLRFVLMKNDRKQPGDKQPDLRLFVDENKPREERNGPPPGRAQTTHEYADSMETGEF